MAKYVFLCLSVISFLAVYAQDNSNGVLIMPSILECYNNSYLLTRDNRLPHNMITLIEIIRKIEESPGSTMRTLTALSQALLHGFRQDGILRLKVPARSNFIPYASRYYTFSRFVKLLKVIAGDAMTFPNSSISDVERCTLHFMLSDTVEREKRDDENCNRNYDNAYRFPRSVDKKFLKIKEEGANDAVEMLSPQEIQSMTNTKQEEDSGVDPNSYYPEFPPNHPAVAQYVVEPSSCPVYSGVIKTKWGEVSGGPLIAAIAAAMQPQLISISQLMSGENVGPEYFMRTPQINNKWFATLSGDLAAACWRQAPIVEEKNIPFIIGANGKWNSSEMPRWFFLDSNEHLELTKPLLRGDIDGLNIANEIASWSVDERNRIRLSQVLDMYYSPRGSLNPQVRACNRQQLLTKSAPTTETLEDQTYSAMKIMKDLALATMDDVILRDYSKRISSQLFTDLANLLKDDLSCAETDRHNDFSRTYVDLTIVLDTNWPFKYIQPILSKLLEGIEVGKYNSNFTLLSSKSGKIMINSSNTILDLYNFNASNYEKFDKGFNMCQSIEIVERLLKEKLDREHTQKNGGGNVDIILFVPYLSSSDDDKVKECVTGIMQNMRLEIPDAYFLFLTSGRKEMATYYVKSEDVFVISSSPSTSNLYPIDSLISRLREYPKRLVNSQCGSRYQSREESAPFSDSVEPRGTKFYRIHPNYFHSTDWTPKVIIEGSFDGQLTVCHSRESLYSNNSKIVNSQCDTINSNSRHTIDLSCGDTDYINQCQPYYISVKSNNSTSTSTSVKCENCRFPDEIKYKISYERLICKSAATSINTLPVIIIFTIVSLFNFVNI